VLTDHGLGNGMIGCISPSHRYPNPKLYEKSQQHVMPDKLCAANNECLKERWHGQSKAPRYHSTRHIRLLTIHDDIDGDSQCPVLTPKEGDLPAPCCTAVIVENREDPWLLEAVHTFLDRLPAPHWQVQVFHTDANHEWLKTHLSKEIHAQPLPRVILTPIPAGHGTSPRNKYSQLMSSLDLMELVPGERMLVFQSDALPCPRSDFDISDFFEYDYVGAPWPGTHHTFLPIALRLLMRLL
jgi:hypothetical protein